MEFRYEYSFAEYYAVIAQLTLRPGPALLIHLLFPIAGCVVVAVSVVSHRGANVYPWITLAVALLFTPLLLLQIALQVWFQGRKKSREILLSLDEGEVIVRNALATTTLTWDKIIEARETGRFFFLHLTRRYAFAIPKRILTGDEPERLRELLRQSVPTGLRP